MIKTERELSAVKIGALCWNQYTSWDAMRAAAVRAEELGYDDVWTWDQAGPKHAGGRRDGVSGK